MTRSRSAIPQRRRLQLVVGIAALGTGIGAATFFSARPRPPSGQATPLDVANLSPGALQTLDWQGRTLWILRRSADDVAALAEHEDELIDPDSRQSVQPQKCRNRHRSLTPKLFVAIGECTHQACVPQLRSGSGTRRLFVCPCHTSRYDLAGRALRTGPALANLVIPDYRLDGPTRVIVGAV
jgi:ubiquinol-cytochrome c reductase iron-sulfur subunit